MVIQVFGYAIYFKKFSLALMELMNRVFKSYFDMVMMVFIDNILVYFQSEKDHMSHLRIIFQILRDH